MDRQFSADVGGRLQDTCISNISAHVFESATARQGQASQTDPVKARFDAIDKNHDKCIDVFEMQQAVEDKLLATNVPAVTL